MSIWTIVFWVAAWLVVHTIVGMSLMKFFVTYSTKDHSKGLCDSGECRPQLDSYQYNSRGMRTKDAFPDEYKPNERRDACIIDSAKQYAFWWIPALFSILPYMLATKHLGTAKANAERLAELEAEEAIRKGAQDKIIAELRGGNRDLDAFARVLETASPVQVAPKGKR